MRWLMQGQSSRVGTKYETEYLILNPVIWLLKCPWAILPEREGKPLTENQEVNIFFYFGERYENDKIYGLAV
jgi:hypothetical protein